MNTLTDHRHRMPARNPMTPAGAAPASRRPALWRRAWTAALGALLVAASGFAQPIDDLIYAAGTTTADSQGRQWSYVIWQANNPEVLRDRSFAVYSKPGDAASSSPFTRQAVVRLTTDPTVIQVLVNRAVNLGENPALLEERLDNLFQKLMPPQGASLAEKISIVIRSSLGTAEHFKNLVLIARVHPAVSLCLGFGYAQQIPNPGQVTYEIRQFDIARDADIAVTGRVTVQAGAPAVLPAPGAPVVVPDVPVTSAKGHLNAKFRWAEPDALRRLSLLSYGFNLYRVTTNYAWPHNFHNVAPAPGVLAQLASQHGDNPSNPPVRLVNKTPILKGKTFGSADVANFNTNSPGGDAQTYFAHDDNDRYKPGAVPFQNGDQYLYFVAARDILGRDGLTSPGTLVTMCDRLPPEAPRGVIVENHYTKVSGSAPQQSLKVSWKQNTNSATETHTFYYVYRWTSHADPLKDTLHPVVHPNRVAGPIAHVPGQDRLTYIDNGFNSPHMPEDAGKTFWYTVRVRDDGACGGNFSPHTGPAFGVLRDRTGPGAPSGSLAIQCCEPGVEASQNRDTGFTSGDDTRAYFRPLCERTSPSIEWAEFYTFNTQPTNFLTRVYFADGQPRVTTDFSVPRSQLIGTQMVVVCRVGASTGKVSAFATANGGVPEPGTRRLIGFRADLDCAPTLVSSSGDNRCETHNPNPDGVGTNDCIDLLINLADGTKEIKVYKRVDFGPMMLIEQGKTSNSTVQIKDCVPIANAGDLCYFAQAYDEHGNASALVPIGTCVRSAGATPIAKPILSPLSPAGTMVKPMMDVTWFCPPYGVQRFEVSVAADGAAAPPDQQPSPKLSDVVRVDPAIDFTVDGQEKLDDFSVYRTLLVGPEFGEGAKFKVSVSIELGRTYSVFIRAIGLDGSQSKRSNVEGFTWGEPATPGPQVPWPDRPLPPVQAVFDPGIVATNMPGDLYPVGIRIGSKLPVVAFTPATNGSDAMIPGFTTPLNYLYAKKDGTTVLPLALYRYQVPNANFSTVSGDILQVSPLMEKIACEHATVAPYGQVTILRDPFVGVIPRPITAGSPAFDLFLLDTQPVITGARYGYLLVRFGPNREIEEVIPTNEVEL